MYKDFTLSDGRRFYSSKEEEVANAPGAKIIATHSMLENEN